MAQDSAAGRKRSTKGQRRTRGPKLDERAAVAAYSAGGKLADVARAAGSRASSERNARRIGHKIVQRALDRGQLLDRFAAVGVNLDTLCANIAARLQATRTIVLASRGRSIKQIQLPDWQAQAKAAQQVMQLTGLLDLPVSRDANPDDALLSLLTDDELDAAIESTKQELRESGSAGDGVGFSAKSGPT